MHLRNICLLALPFLLSCGHVAGMQICGDEQRLEPEILRTGNDAIVASMRYDACQDLSLGLCWVDPEFSDGDPPEVELGVYVVSGDPNCDEEFIEDVPFPIDSVYRHFRRTFDTDTGTVRIRIGELTVDHEFTP